MMDVKQTKAKNIVLFVGEGDFSYAASYMEKSNLMNEHVFATCLSSETLSSRQKSNIELIESNGGSVLTDVDATQIETHPVLEKFLFAKIVFNFPHVPKKMNIRENRKLVELFLKSAEKVLDLDGKIQVALCRGQGGTEAEHHVRKWGNSWQIVELASRAGLVLSDIKPFDEDNFEKYKCTGFRGLSKSFRMEAAVTHVFSHGSPVSLDLNAENVSFDELVEWFHSNNGDLYKSLSQKSDSPHARLVGDISSILKTTTTTIHSVFIEGLLSCETIFSSKINLPNTSMEMSAFERSNFCDRCLRIILSIFLSKDKSQEAANTSLICCVSCACYINVSKSPLIHLLSYFSLKEDSLMDGLQVFLKSLKELSNLNLTPGYSSWKDIKNYSTETVKAEEHITTSDEIVIEEILSLQVACSTKKGNCRIFYTDIEIISNDKELISDKDNSFKIGHIVKFTYNKKSYFSALLNLELICVLRYHVTDFRTLLLDDAFFSTEIFQDMPLLVFRSPSLYPPTYTHDISFWVGDNFEEKHLFLLVRRTVGFVVKSITLIDLYYDKETNRKGMCYRFVYGSVGEVLSKELASSVHSRMRRTIERALKVILR